VSPEPLQGTPAPCPGGCEHPLTAHSADLGCWLCDCVHGRPAPGLTSALNPGRIIPVPLAEAVEDPGAVPAGTTASRCLACDEVRLHYPGSPLDPWKKDFDYCGDDPEDTGGSRQAVPGEAGRRSAGLAAGHQAVTDAELAARGIHPASIAAPPETGQDTDLLCKTLPGLAAGCGTRTGTRGGNEHATYLFSGSGADAAAAAFMARVLEVAPRLWRITPTAYPVWREAGEV
jgi:hypothetical protein